MRPRGLLAATLAAAIALLLPIGCSQRPDSRLPAEISRAPGLVLFEYDRIPIHSQIRLLERTPGNISRRVTLSFPTRPEWDALHAVYSLPAAAIEPVPLVVLLPALSGNRRLTDYFAGYLNRRGFACLQPEPNRDLLAPGQDLAETGEVMRQRVVDVRRLLDWALQQEEIDSSRVAVFGVSLGALVASLAAATEDRLSASVLILGGGNLAEILAGSADHGVRRYRDSVMESFGWSKGEFRRQARFHLDEVDPLSYADRLDSSKTLIVEAIFDRVIPARSRWEFWSRAGRPRRILLPAGHYSAILLAPYVRWKIFQFFRFQFQTKPAIVEVSGN